MTNGELFDCILTDEDLDRFFLNSPVDLENNFDFYLEIKHKVIFYIYKIRPENSKEIISQFLLKMINLKTAVTSCKIENRIDFLLLSYTADIIKCYNVTGHFHFCYDVISLGIFNVIWVNGEKYDINSYRVFKHLDSNDKNVLKNSLHTTINWLGQFYYYSRSFSGLNEFGILMIDETMDLIAVNDIETEEFAFFISNVYSWCELNNLKTELNFLPKKIIKLNEKLNGKNDEGYNETIKLEIILKNIGDLSLRKKIALELLDHNWKNLISRTQFFVNSYVNDLLPNFKLENLVKEVNLLNHNFICFDKLSQIHEKSRFSKILNPLSIYCFKNNKYNELNTVFCAFYKSTITSKSILYMMPNSELGSYLLSANKHFLFANDVTLLIPELVKYQNLSLNQFKILKGREYENEVPSKEIGRPEYKYKYGDKFESSLSKLYNFKELISFFDNGVDSYFHFDYNSLPLQAIMIKSIEKSLPRQVSFKHKNNFRKITKILFWKGNSFSSDMEYSCVKEIFEQNNIELILSNPTKKDFLKHLQSDFQIIWISSHGEHSHYSPFDSKIVLDDNVEISLSEFESLKNPFVDTRRLLLCNICEGGTMTQTGDLINVGFPALLTNANQDFLSHLWMIDFKFAMIYGALFAVFISKGYDYLESYNNTVLTLLKGKDSIINELIEYNSGASVSELIRRINDMEDYDFSNILYWGSSAYYV
ncbi:hypothetical protein [Flavobacterium frigidarium]|uniref:hypothetical protein n=1 Tax=Flavobacterium frigidarium TaxID=99286 RepID=UPI000422A7C0|nr:hypothetical protein [Flavobacterium frigidarium]